MSVLNYLQAHSALFAALAGALGLLVGSFLNVVIYRLPVMLDREWRADCRQLLDAGEVVKPTDRFNLLVPLSHCPNCGHRVRAHENVPVLSYLLLKGRCAQCGWRIPLRYPLVELVTGGVSAVVAWHFGAGAAGVGALLLTWSLIALTFIDLDTQLLPDVITLPFLWLGLAFNLSATFASLTDAVLGAMLGYGLLWSVFQLFRLITGKEGMGFGDFKLLAMLGAWQGWQVLPVIVLLSSVVGAIVGTGLMLARGHDRNVPIPFGPYIAMAGWVSLLWGQDLMRAYLDWGGVSG